MYDIKTGIRVKDVMDKKFPILDISIPLIRCIKKINHQHEACIIVRDGKFYGVLGYDDLLRGFMYGRDKDSRIEDIKITNNYETVTPDLDVHKTLELINKTGKDFVLVKDKDHFVGLVTKREIIDVGPELFLNVKENL